MRLWRILSCSGPPPPRRCDRVYGEPPGVDRSTPCSCPVAGLNGPCLCNRWFRTARRGRRSVQGRWTRHDVVLFASYIKLDGVLLSVAYDVNDAFGEQAVEVAPAASRVALLEVIVEAADLNGVSLDNGGGAGLE